MTTHGEGNTSAQALSELQGLERVTSGLLCMHSIAQHRQGHCGLSGLHDRPDLAAGKLYPYFTKIRLERLCSALYHKLHQILPIRKL